MKDAKVKSEKTVKDAEPRRLAGVQVRSGVKAGIMDPYGHFEGPGR